MQKIGISLQKLGMALVVSALLAAVVAFIWRSANPQLETQTDGSGRSIAVGETPTALPLADLPALKVPPADSEVGISRLAMMHTNIPERPRSDVITYTVNTGDNLFAIADQFGLKPETVLWGNYETLRDNPQFLKPGQELAILPVDGVYYQVPAGENLNSIAEFFEVEPEAIINFSGNGFMADLTNPQPAEVAVGQWLVIPGGRRELKDWGPPAISRSNPAAAAYYGSGYCGKVYEGAIGMGVFIWPTTSKVLSGYDYNSSIHPGIDIGGSTGNAIYATDSGVVVFAGWSEYGYGYMVVLDHGNGWQSAYAHLSAVSVGCGASVAQGQVIGCLGSTGNSTGPHLHFELRHDAYGKVNPWDFLIY